MAKEIEEAEKKNKYFWPRLKYMPSGKLSFKIYDADYGSPCSEFTDGEKSSLEERLNKCIVSLFRTSLRLKVEEIQRLEREKQWIMERHEREKRERQTRQENFKIDLLIKQADMWNRADVLRRFISEVKNSHPTGTLHDQPSSWLSWATSKANQMDPLSEDFLGRWNSTLRRNGFDPDENIEVE